MVSTKNVLRLRCDLGKLFRNFIGIYPFPNEGGLVEVLHEPGK
jgi:hypothetical protein